MVKTIQIPWAAWYGDKSYSLQFPDSWKIHVYGLNKAEKISKNQIKDSLLNPINSSSIEEIAKGKKSAVIVLEDISRPTKADYILEILINQLNNSGIDDNSITLLYALGAHRPMTRIDSVKKVGINIINRVNIENHHPYENLKYIGNSKQGTPIYINRTYYNAEVKIAIGTVLPHPLAGFGGGAKIILPGICGIKTLEENHKAGIHGIGIGLGIITELRKDIENICSKVGLDYSVNIVSTMNRKIAGIYVGHFIDAHRKAIEHAKKVYSTAIPSDTKLDIGFFNLYPEDTEFSQSLKGLNFFLASKRFIRRGGAVILMTAATEGRGYHSLQGETGARLYQNWGDSIIFRGILRKLKFGIFSPNINKFDILHYYPERTIFKKKFNEMVRTLEELYGNSPEAGIIPCSNQLP